jgi:hypothetical protein
MAAPASSSYLRHVPKVERHVSLWLVKLVAYELTKTQRECCNHESRKKCL